MQSSRCRFYLSLLKFCLLVAAFGALRIAAYASWTTWVGMAVTQGGADGQGSGARFNNPAGLAIDLDGKVYVADTDNHTIRRVTTSGTVSTIAGVAGMSGAVDGAGASARFNSPSGLAVGNSGNVYVADTANHTIRRISTGGTVSTLAGSAGRTGTDDGVGAAALFNSPSSLAVDSLGNVYVADSGNHTIRQITLSGNVSTIAGSPGKAGTDDGFGASARFRNPSGLAADSSGNLYVADTDNHTIRCITISSGRVRTIAGMAGVSGPIDAYYGYNARFFSPSGVAVDGAGKVYVADTGNYTVRTISAGDGYTVQTIGGHASVRGVIDSWFYGPKGIAIDTGGSLFVADTGSDTIRKLTLLFPPVIAQVEAAFGEVVRVTEYTPPGNVSLNMGSTVTFNVTASGAGPIAYQWRKDGVMIAGATGSSYKIEGIRLTDAGAYDVVVTNGGGGVTGQLIVLAVEAKLSAVISGPLNQQILTPADPLGYSASNLPSGVAFNASTGVLSGSPIQTGTFAVSIIGNTQGAVPLNFEINVAALDPKFVGAFQGWIQRNVTLNKNLGSSVQITTNSRGAYSGKLVTGVNAIAFHGTLIATAVSSTLPQTARILCVLPKTSGTLDLSLDGAGNLLSGTLSDGSANTVGVDGWRDVWPTMPGNAFAFRELHTFYLEQSNGADESLPQGSGFGSLLVSLKSGICFVTASLSDGAKMSSSTFLGPDGEGLLYGSLYTNLGSVVGRMDLDSYNNVSGNLTWMRPDLSAKTALTYRGGFAPIELMASGGSYVPPNKGELILGLSSGAGTAQLVLSSGGLSDEISQAVTVTSLGSTSSVNHITVPVNFNQLRVSSLSVSTGGFSGSFVIPGTSAADPTRRASFDGQLVQTPGGTVKGYGYFLLPKPPAAGQTMASAPKLSGKLLLRAP